MTKILESASLTLARERMVDSQLRSRGIRDERVLAAMARVPRHLFVPLLHQASAYEDRPLPIGMDQTISQPYIVATMLESLLLAPSDRVFEVGTGSGYVTALLCELCDWVYSVERHASLLEHAESALSALGYKNATLAVGDGSRGYPEAAPFDAILVSAAAPEVPPELLAQLSEGGRMVIPVGAAIAQELLLVVKRGGLPYIRRMEGCRFVPLIVSALDAGHE